MNEARLPLSVRLQYGLVGRKGAGRARAWQSARLSKAGFRHYKMLLRCGVRFDEAYAKALAVG